MKGAKLWTTLFIWCLALVATRLMAADIPEVEGFEATVKGLGSFTIQTEGEISKATFSIGYPSGGRYAKGRQTDWHKYFSYSTRVHMIRDKRQSEFGQIDTYEKTVVSIACKEAGVNIEYFLWPHFNECSGLYSHESVVKLMPYWKEHLPLGEEREYRFRFEPDTDKNDGMLVYLESSVLGKLKGVTAVKDIKTNSKNMEIVKASAIAVRDSGMLEMQPLMDRSSEYLKKGAKLSVGTGRVVIGGIPMTVWSPEQSIDQGLTWKTTNARDLVWDPFMERTSWSIGREFMLWNIPGRTWRYAYILCADIPEEGKEATVGTQFMKLGRGCTSGNINLEITNLNDPKFANRIRTVGTLTYEKDGKTLETPLYLVRQPLDINKLGIRGQKKDTLNFEFMGSGIWADRKRSSVQIFGCTLREAPFTVEVNNPVRGNLFEEGTERYTLIDFRATADNVKGSMNYRIFDPLFKELKNETIPFEIAKRGGTAEIKIDFSEFGRGWYGMAYEFYDERGAKLAAHDAAFTVLAADDREAGYESPYAAWPLGGGYHNSNPNPYDQLEVMRKAGYRKSWQPPLKTEEECAPWKVTCSSVGQPYMQPDKPAKTRADLDKKLDNAVAFFRKRFEEFPHCEVIQLLHEQGGRGIAPELTGAKEPVRGVYRGWDFDNPDTSDNKQGLWEAFYCTEFAKRMRKEFPDKRIMIGNGSSASEKIASLARNGFDFSLVDELGIESKGFGSLPEFNANRESPGMLWALRETARVFGFYNLKLNACNEYVFRTERKVDPAWTPWRIMRVANYSVRDYLLSVAYGCDIISHGHLEDCNDAYYDTNWGAGGQCTFYPYSYPKRMFTGIAVLTRALDKPRYLRRVPTGEITAYALEFIRERSVRDFAYALWTPHYTVTLDMTFPADTAVRKIEFFGQESELTPDENGKVTVDMGGSPCYVIASKPVLKAQVVKHAAPEIPEGSTFIDLPSVSEMKVSDKPNGGFGNGWEVPEPWLGQFAFKDVKDDELNRNVIEVELKKEGKEPPAVIWEYTQLDLPKPIKINLKEIQNFGILVKGNSSFSQVKLVLRRQFRGDEKLKGPWWLAGKPQSKVDEVMATKADPLPAWMGDERAFVAFEGWQLMEFAKDDGDFNPWQMEGAEEVEILSIICGSARKALDPIEMADVTTNLRLGPIVLKPKQKAVEKAFVVPDAMDTVEDKDW